MITTTVPRQMRVLMFSGGIGSFSAGKRIERPFTMLFADPMMEDSDLYRFVSEAAANLAGVTSEEVSGLAEYARQIPAIEDCGSAEEIQLRRDLILTWQTWAQDIIPGLVIVCDGRTPWEVYADRRFIGNSRVDPCSEELKRSLLDEWREKNCDPATTTIYIGIDWTESHRLTRLQKRVGVWNYEAPLCKAPYKLKRELLSELEAEGIAVPELYRLGFSHNNCGGMCCKAGHAHYATLLRVKPKRYAYHEAKEQDLMTELDSPWGMLTDRSGDGKKKPLTLKTFREIMEGKREGNIDLADDLAAGCGCALN